jgi:hypothetical protein
MLYPNSNVSNLLLLFRILSFLTAAPPAMGLMGRFDYEPCGTMCTIDYWHGNFRHYNLYMFTLTIFGFIIPIGFM